LLISVVGAQQGSFAGPVSGKIDGLSFDSDVSTPFDQASGQTTGRRQYKPITIRKQTDATSPQFLKALVTNENLTTVTLDFYRPSGPTGRGSLTLVYQVKLTDARVVEVKQGLPDQDAATPQFSDAGPFDQISFTFQKITWTWTQGDRTANDTWGNPG
jgi:type VI secretion system secreted protein Hcp